MSTQQTSHDNPLADFGPNEWIVDEMYQRYLADPTSVDPAWHDFFADYKPAMATGSIVTPDEATAANTFACSLVILVVIAIPWRFVFDHYVRQQGDRWSAAQ